MAWDKETLVPLERDRKQADELFAALLRQVASGEMTKDDAWSMCQQSNDDKQVTK